MDCVFCRIAAHAIPATIRHETADIVAFDDLHPRAPLHVLLIPKRHIPSVRELDDGDAGLMGELVIAARTIAQAQGIAAGGYRLVVNCGNDGGQEVAHLHLHLIGGKRLGAMAG
ncbi:histidine triad nucleotide-binding protein [Candidatus Uhrbacteria bacterium]|nr:histidine triad nucleotide-binding protein [Candidatus Uhrbacteria bacterium]